MPNLNNIGVAFVLSCPNLKTFIMKGSEVLALPLTKSSATPTTIYVTDELLEQYQEVVQKFADKFKPLSEYKPE